jgi:quercetin dioxygenase-like cupin family protein
MAGQEGNAFKILSVSENPNQVVLIVRFAPHALYPRHVHKCCAVAYTLEGEWEYDEGVLPTGSCAIEPPNSDHEPRISAQGATIFAVLNSDTDDFVEVPMEGGEVLRQDFAYWRDLYEMSAEDAAKAQDSVGVAVQEIAHPA